MIFARTLTARTVTAMALLASPGAPLHAQAAKAVIAAMLDGGSEAIPGDADGTGNFQAEFDPASGEVCYRFVLARVARPTLIQIHMGATGSNGPAVIFLEPGSDVCVEADPAVVAAILANPEGHYVNFYNREFPTGAVRGQLAAR